jgi:hypothetical protein
MALVKVESLRVDAAVVIAQPAGFNVIFNGLRLVYRCNE